MTIAVVNQPENICKISDAVKWQDAQNISCLLIFWNGPEDYILEMMQKANQNRLKIILYDASRKLGEKEAEKAFKNGIILFEPYLITRPYFQYLPESVDWLYPSPDLQDNNYDSGLGLVYHERVFNTKLCEKYEVIISDTKPDVLDSTAMLYFTAQSNIDLRDGKIPHQLFRAVYNCTLPIIPIEHRWFHGLVSQVGGLISSKKDVDFLLKTYHHRAWGYCAQFLENTEKNYPEFKHNHFENVIKYAVNS